MHLLLLLSHLVHSILLFLEEIIDARVQLLSDHTSYGWNQFLVLRFLGMGYIRCGQRVVNTRIIMSLSTLALLNLQGIKNWIAYNITIISWPILFLNHWDLFFVYVSSNTWPLLNKIFIWTQLLHASDNILVTALVGLKALALSALILSEGVYLLTTAWGSLYKRSNVLIVWLITYVKYIITCWRHIL